MGEGKWVWFTAHYSLLTTHYSSLLFIVIFDVIDFIYSIIT